MSTDIEGATVDPVRGEETLEAAAPVPSRAAVAALVLLVLACFAGALDNFFADDDFHWLFDASKIIGNPLAFNPPYCFTNQPFFARPTEALFFVANALVCDLCPLPFFLSSVLAHTVNALLLACLVTRLTRVPLAGLLAAAFWALNYKHVEVVFRIYGVADSLALMGCLGAYLLWLRRRPWLAATVFAVATLAKENACVLPLILVLHVLVFEPGQIRRRILSTAPLWAVAAAFCGLGWLYGSRTSYLALDGEAVARFWDLMLTYVGPDAASLQHIVLGRDAPLTPPVLAWVLLPLVPLAVWRLRGVSRFGLLWLLLWTLPTVFVPHQSSRYHYIPLVGLGMIVGPALASWLRGCVGRRSRVGLAAAGTVCGLLVVLFVVGINAQENDYEMLGELHRQGALSLELEIVPQMARNEHTVAVFVADQPERHSEVLFRHHNSRPWYLPGTYKWVFRRPFGVFGLTDTHAFVSYCLRRAGTPALFVPVDYDDYLERVSSGDFYVVVHHTESNTFHLGPAALRQRLQRRADDPGLYRSLQPGRLDFEFRGSLR